MLTNEEMLRSTSLPHSITESEINSLMTLTGLRRKTILELMSFASKEDLLLVNKDIR